ncbi:helix-turn-helix domain-containing protein [Saccharomonospora sp. NPDC046836]|uniref:TetR/AcrR family transcriptional regulator n=1 Tax=Saccharomonospora sp. NPDC046836 TaxID=3156921 RepID=UPI0033D41123
MTGAVPRSPSSSDDGRVMLDLLSAESVSAGKRADAVRNRARLLEAAAELVAERGAANLTMDAVATAACVGKGTVFRRFGDREGLLLALLNHSEEQFQEAMLTGPPPLGPGAEAGQRLHAYGPARLHHENASIDLYLAAEPGPLRRYLVPAYGVHLTHIRMLLRQVGVDGDIELLAHMLLRSLDTASLHHLVCQRGLPVERLEAGWHDLVTRLTGH